MDDKKLLAIMYDFYNCHTLRDQNKDIDYYIMQIKKYSAKKVLVIGSGTGRVAIPLSNYAKVTALDFDEERLKILKSKSKNINVICCDFLNFKSLEKYDLIIIPYSTIQFGGDITKINMMFNKLNQIMTKKTICIFDVSESFNEKTEKTEEFLFENFCDEIKEKVKVYYSSKRYNNYIEFFIEYRLVKKNYSVIENEKYCYYNQELFATLLDRNDLIISKIDNGYGDNILQHKHLYHCRRGNKRIQ